MKTKVCVECGRDFRIGKGFYLLDKRTWHAGSRCPKCRAGMGHVLDVVDYMERVARRRSGRTSASDGVDHNANRQ